MTSPRRIVIVAPLVPYDAPPHAGGQYLQRVVRLAEQLGPTSVVVPDGPTNRATRREPGAPADLHVVGLAPGRSLPARAGNRATVLVEQLLRRADPGLPSFVLARGLLAPGPVRELIRGADVVDLQWSEQIRLARLVRRVNPRARIVGTYHDVQSQLFAREPAESAAARARWRLATWQSRRHERRGVAVLDEVAVFSRKDAHLLGDPPRLRVIHPPLATGHEAGPGPAPVGPPTVVFVAHLARPENDDGARWLLHEVWPTVTAAVPGVRLRLVGHGISAALRDLVAARPEVEAPGFVADLDGAYAAASLAVVPLRQGAGVKFKTVEALLHGVPVVTTTVGAEGVGGPDLFAGLSDDPATFARAMVHALARPGTARERASSSQEWAARTYSVAAFEQSLSQHYGMSGTPLPPGSG